MVAKILIAVVAVIAATLYMTFGITWFVCSSLSENPKARRRARFADWLLSAGLAAYYIVQAIRGKEPRLAGIMFGLVVAWWLILGAISVLRRSRA